MPSYTVKSGDTLSGIASKVGLGANNYSQFGYAGDPRKLQVGTVLNWGAPAGPAPAAASPSGNAAAPAPSPAASGGLPNVNVAYQPATDQASSIATSRQALIDKLNSEGNANYSDLNTAIKGQETATDAYKRLYDQNGLGDLNTVIQNFKGSIYNTKSLLNNLDKDVNDRTQGTLTTQGQQDRIKAVEGGKLNDQISQLSNGLQPAADAYTAGTNLVNTQVGLLQQDEAKQLQPYQLKIQNFADRAAREISGFDKSSEEALNVTLKKIDSGVQLSADEWKQAQDAILKREEYQNNFNIASLQAEKSIEAAKIGANATVSAAGAQAGATIKAAGLNSDASKYNSDSAIRLLDKQNSNPLYKALLERLNGGGTVNSGTAGAISSFFPGVNLQGGQ